MVLWTSPLQRSVSHVDNPIRFCCLTPHWIPLIVKEENYFSLLRFQPAIFLLTQGLCPVYCKLSYSCDVPLFVHENHGPCVLLLTFVDTVPNPTWLCSAHFSGNSFLLTVLNFFCDISIMPLLSIFDIFC